MKRRKRFHTPSEIQEHLSRQKASSLSVDEYCAQEKVAVSTFWNWRKRYKGTTSTSSSVPVPFVRLGTSPFVPAQGFEVVFDNKVLVRVPSRFDEASLRSLVSIVR